MNFRGPGFGLSFLGLLLEMVVSMGWVVNFLGGVEVAASQLLDFELIVVVSTG